MLQGVHRWLGVCIGFLLLTSCGFHLRGMHDAPMWINPAFIVIENANHDLASLLQEQLQAYNIHASSSPQQAKAWIVIEHDNLEQRVNSISSSTTPRQYQLIYTVRFKVQHAMGRELMPSRNIVVLRELTVNSNRILGSNSEAGLLEHEMRREAAIQMLNRISAFQSRPSR